MAQGRVIPADFLQFEGFLDAKEHSRLLEFVRTHEDELGSSQVDPPSGEPGQEDTDVRRSRVLHDLDEVWPLFQERLQALLPHVRKELGLPWFPVDDVERQLTVHGDGDFFASHSDSSGTEAQTRTRILTFVYYFNMEPKGFTGGELRLYDGDDRDGIVYPADTYKAVEPIDNSIVLFPSWLHHEVRPVRAEAPGLFGCRFSVNGWFRAAPIEVEPGKGGGVRVAPPRMIDPEELTELQKRLLPSYTETGFAVVPTPPDVQEVLADVFEERRDEIAPEHGDSVYLQTGDPEFLSVGELADEVLCRLQPLHEQWAGVELVPRAAYGLRVYRAGQTLRRHCDRVETHVISSIVHVASDVDEPWPLTIEDLDGTPHDVVLEPGQMVLYESARLPHARNRPLVGRHYASLFAHYQPASGWDWTLDKVYELGATS